MENKIDYSKLSEITVKTQEELDLIPLDFKGRIYISGERKIWIVVKNRYNYSVVLIGDTSAELYGNSSAVLRENSSAVLYGNSSADGYGNSQIVNQTNGKISVFGNARIVFMPKTIYEFMDFFGIKHDKKKAIFYKAVHKDKNGVYFSDYNNNFIYKIGEVVEEECDPDVKEGCSNGIHVSTQNWALEFGKDWDDLAILELETDIDKIVLPKNSDGKVRTSEAKVLREVPLEECGLYGKILAKRRVK